MPPGCGNLRANVPGCNTPKVYFDLQGYLQSPDPALQPPAFAADSADFTGSADSAVSESGCSDWTPVPLNPRLNGKRAVLKTWGGGAANGLAAVNVRRRRQPSVCQGPPWRPASVKTSRRSYPSACDLSLGSPHLLTAPRPIPRAMDVAFPEQWLYVQPVRGQFIATASGGRERES